MEVISNSEVVLLGEIQYNCVHEVVGVINSVKGFVCETDGSSGLVMSLVTWTAENPNCKDDCFTLSLPFNICSTNFFSEIKHYGLVDTPFVASLLLLDNFNNTKNKKFSNIFNCSLLSYKINFDSIGNNIKFHSVLPIPQFMYNRCIEEDLDLEWNIMRIYENPNVF